MPDTITGGRTTYGHVVGILMSDSTVPRIPGDPGHAETFDFPVIYQVLKDFPFDDLIAIKKDNVDILINSATALQDQGVSLIVADCGLFGPFHEDFRTHLTVPFIGTALDIVVLLQRWLPPGQKVGILTGDTRILTERHLAASGISSTGGIVFSGMEKSSEFSRVVIERGHELNVDAMRQDVMDAASTLCDENLGAVVLECTNLISFRHDIQKLVKVPVFDLVSLIDFHVSGLRAHRFQTRFIQRG